MTTTYLPEILDLEVEEDAVTEGGKKLYFHLRSLFGRIEQYLKESNREVNDVIITGGVGNVFYFGLPNDSGVYPDGTWRIYTDSTDFKVDKKVSGSWVSYGQWS